MCGNRRRQARMNACGAYGRGQCGSTSHAGTNITAIIGALQQVRLNSVQPQPQLPAANQTPQNLNVQTQGVAYPTAMDEKRDVQLSEKVEYEELPSYEASTEKSGRALSSTTAPVFLQADAFDAKMQQQPSNPMVLMGLQHFNAGLDAYRQGDDKAAKRAAKSFVKDLYAQERERRKATRGYLQCGERKQIKRELQPLKEMMKEAVREAKMERRMQRAV